ncbi:hypothetical protein [Luteimonas qiangzhengi]|uniref:hypothetical protein n=1 Tax=Luteimonas sp. MJ146 TaxID=3129240 RepID=UPI0031BBBA8F
MIYALLAVAALMFGLYNVFIKLSADHIQAVLGAVVLQFVAAFMGLAWLLYLQATQAGSLHFNSRGLALAAFAGVAIGLVEILTFFVYGRGLPVAVGNPLIIGGSLLVTTTAGILLLRESLSPVQLAAIGLIGLGIAAFAWEAARQG